MARYGRGRKRQGQIRRTSGMLESVLLLLLHHEPAHGYTLLEGLAEFNLDALDPSAVYRMLREMEERGWVTSTWNGEQTLGPPRRVYRITDGGDEVLAEWMQNLAETRDMLDRLVGEYRAHMEVCKGEHYPRAVEEKTEEDE